ncbi:hypothetical protein EVAR_23910_1 [Eumeta japonica]|uniref:Uncharacterized protein n=1 Tax=Eumeta variegata TaxID=151549 RepID=A0A4C1V167_EUMVA|nr:hypothetical protein EVAR_23910_1 [Eumeta japonica]
MCRHAAEFRCGPVVSRVPDVDADGRPALDVDLGRMTRCDRTRAAWTIGDRFGMRMFLRPAPATYTTDADDLPAAAGPAELQRSLRTSIDAQWLGNKRT